VCLRVHENLTWHIDAVLRALSIHRYRLKNPEMMTNHAVIGTADSIDHLLQPWQQMALRLVPLVGESGFCALLGRSARLAAARFAWLVPTPAGKSIDVLLSSLRVLFAAAGPSEASLANEAILHTFTKLLAGLIGEALTMQLLDAAPAGGTDMTGQEQQ
jgi:hypothetical protein